MSGLKRERRINSLTGLRFWMIMIIVFSHLEFLKDYPYGEFYYQYLHNAQLGVDFFFMMSGFGMMYTYGKNLNSSLRGGVRFAIKRVKRIYPIYAVSLIWCVPIDFMHLLDAGASIERAIRIIGGKMICCLALLQSAMGVEYLDRSFNSVCWFLSTLFIIYIISPLLVQKINFVNERWLLACSVGMIGVILFIFYIFQILQQVTYFDDLNYASPYFRFLFVVMGMMLERLYESISNRKIDIGYFEYAGVIRAIVWFLYRNHWKAHIYICRLLDVLIAAVLLLVVALGKRKITQFLGLQKSIVLGNMSMYIYLIHYPIRLYADIVVRRYKVRSILGNVTGIVETLLILVATAVVVYYTNLLMQKRIGSVERS